MIVISIDDYSITAEGHAGYARPGDDDIVCAAVSILIQTFICSIEELTEDCIEYQIAEGYAYIKYENLSERGRLLEGSLLIGLGGLAEGYGKYVQLHGADGRKAEIGEE